MIMVVRKRLNYVSLKWKCMIVLRNTPLDSTQKQMINGVKLLNSKRQEENQNYWLRIRVQYGFISISRIEIIHFLYQVMHHQKSLLFTNFKVWFFVYVFPISSIRMLSRIFCPFFGSVLAERS